ncbi:MAG: cysteine desulfurase family protein [Alphaproteobacteria bacterium]|nr:cysteine desulfurase family protein [Alphaproteobacteria bacterium]
MMYLDYNATSPLRPSVKAAMEALGDAPLNPSSVHAAGRAAKKQLEDARALIAQALGAFPNEVLFTGSASEANTMVLRGFADRALLISAVEHASISRTGALLGAATIPVDSDGIVKLDVLERQLEALGRPALVSVMLANNETGVIQPIAEIARLVHAHGGLLHVDAVQALGKISVDWGLLGADMLTIGAHKAGGPLGVGALLIRNDLAIKSLITGGGQELGRRAGTENIPAIVGFAQLVQEVAHFPEAASWLAWRTWLEKELIAAAPEAIICGEGAARLPNTLTITMPQVQSETQVMNFDLAGFAVSAGSACSSGRVTASSVLLAMGVPPEIATTAIRISWGWATTRAQIEAFVKEWKAIYLRVTRKAAETNGL